MSGVAYLVVTDGAGEFDSDFSVIVYRTKTPKEAIDSAIKDGYGKAVAYVAKLEDVSAFGLGEQRTTMADPKPWGDIVAAMPPAMQKFADPDGLLQEATR